MNDKTGSMGMPAANFEIDRLQKCCQEYRNDIEELQSVLKDIFAMIDERLLVRNISNDNDPLWALEALNFTRRLANSHKLIQSSTDET